ncbi:ATP-binding cassette domain-containing protein [Clostridium sp. SM-530-WT-3G]|uniref:ATP-binding cassette domain-containing protein n=1 Tax=Clostridium sp. SM-530-WT-3G TaxID=2725303 RepID=UPI00145C7C35|nr:ATP-binding cassette domain-containing protein [Clostridium sp. SM-530-WT-3G]
MININNLCFSYIKGNNLIKNINLNIPKGAYVSVLGENGSCKSTLIKLILGLLKPDSGIITIDSSKISYVPQRVDNFNSDFPLTVKELLLLQAKALKIKNKEIVNNVLKEVNMSEFKNKLIGNLSGGQQQRIFIARALIGDPDLIILDEPSTGVDEKSQNEIYPLLKNLNINKGKTIISVEHNSKIALKYSTHILKVENGSFTLYKTSEFIKQMENDKDSIHKIV